MEKVESAEEFAERLSAIPSLMRRASMVQARDAALLAPYEARVRELSEALSDLIVTATAYKEIATNTGPSCRDAVIEQTRQALGGNDDRNN
jgi:phosphopantetheine adenylyltransferase